MSVVCQALEPLPEVRAAWEGGSAAFDAVDAYADIDLNFIVDEQCSLGALYDAAEHAWAKISPIAVAHSVPRLLFDKGSWTNAQPLDQEALYAKRDVRIRELQDWFVVSQSFVRKAVLRGQQVEALASFWGYTRKRLSVLLRMSFCPLRRDFGGMRYLDRDLPSNVYDEFTNLVFVTDLADLEAKRAAAEEWGVRLLGEPGSGDTGD